MNSVGTKIAVLIHIPFSHIRIGIQAVLDVAGINHFIAHHSAVPSADVADNDNRLRKLDIEIFPFIGKILAIGFNHIFIQLMFVVWISVNFIDFKEILIIVTPIIRVEIYIAPDNMLIRRSVLTAAHHQHLPNRKRACFLQSAPEAL